MPVSQILPSYCEFIKVSMSKLRNTTGWRLLASVRSLINEYEDCIQHFTDPSIPTALRKCQAFLFKTFFE